MADRSYAVYYKDMRDFAVSKLISLSIPIALIGIGAFLWTGAPPTYWWFLVIVTMVLGYMHAAVGFFYQMRSFHRAPNTGRLVLVFGILAAASVFICLWFIARDLVGPFVMLVFTYFILHGFINERSLLSMQANIQLPNRYFIMLTLLGTATIYGSLLHPSFFFDWSLGYYTISERSRLWVIEQGLGADPKHIAYIFYAAAACALAYTLPAIRHYRGLVFATAVAFVVALGSLFALYPLNYVYLFHLFLSYHFIVWSVVFYQKYRAQAPERVRGYLLHHAYVTVPLLILLALYLVSDADVVQAAGSFVFDIRTFLTVSFLHITVSFMNEPWFKSLFRLT